MENGELKERRKDGQGTGFPPRSDPMIPQVLQAKHLGDHREWREFNDGVSGVGDFSNELDDVTKMTKL
jgi:hypothetical protein